MIGFLSSVIGEFLTGKGTLGQVGLVTPNPSLAATITIVATGATFYATWLTIFKADARKIDPMYGINPASHQKLAFAATPNQYVLLESEDQQGKHKLNIWISFLYTLWSK